MRNESGARGRPQSKQLTRVTFQVQPAPDCLTFSESKGGSGQEQAFHSIKLVNHDLSDSD
jgi:hypothetical protein